MDKHALMAQAEKPIVEEPTLYAVPPPYHEMPYDPPQQLRQVVQNVYSAPPQVGPQPASTVCPSCRQAITTRMDYESTTKTHLMAFLLCALGCCLCLWCPYVMDSCKNANHYCPSCNAYIGTYQK